ncbi:disulfide bond formation protein DsbA [Kocuria coralli]|uniref:Disulfide bond formation protein DsbA n=1 Tax=Kocuria coralli TaxID=1461025 RepID=A0A5J5KYI4_9MICC|nr:thioredoxin domain-containing protein [Kocuria coralli]KAA9394733.1 disulfide bond formation protein DsbA [Kocuria coralli]
MANKTDPNDFRAQARQIADRHARSDARQRKLLIGGIALLVVIVLVIALLVVWQVRSQRVADSGPVPSSSNQYGGIVMTADGIEKDTSDVQEVDVTSVPSAPETPPAEPDADGVVEPGTAADSGDPVQIVVWQDFDCVHCADFEHQYGDEITDLVDSGDATIEYRTVNFLDNATNYSSRAANAFYAVADQAGVQEAMDFQLELFEHQGTGGLDDQQIVDIASNHGADISEAVDSGEWRTMVNYTTALSQANGIGGTPTVMIDGTVWDQEQGIKDAVEAAQDGEG